jgi:Tfp pilus assembly protein PilF
MPSAVTPIIARLKNLPRAGALFVIIAATFLVYLPALRNGFVWDDHALVQRDPLIRSWLLIPEGFRHYLFIDATPSNFYRPIQRLSFVPDYAIWAFNPVGYHLTSILLHCAAAAALYCLARMLLPPAQRDRWAFVVALIWALHPLHTSAVTYVAGRADPLAALFGFVALALGFQSLARSPREHACAAGAFVCFAGALFSKESGLLFIVIWFLFLARRKVGLRLFATWALALALLVGGYVTTRSFAERTPPPTGRSAPLAVRPILVARAVAEYAGLLVMPRNLQMERDVATRAAADPGRTIEQARRREFQTLLGMSLIAAMLMWFRWARRSRPEAFMALGAFVLAYLPISNVFPLNASVAEHWLYAPSAFLFIAIAGSIGPIIARGRCVPQRIAFAVIALAAVLLGARTFVRQPDWIDQRTFIMRTIESGGDSARMRVNLGQLESSEGHDETALAQFQIALAKQPDLSFALLGMAAVQVRLGRFEAAREYLRRAETHPEMAVEVLHLRAALEAREAGRNTIALLEEAAQMKPRYWPARQRYVRALMEQGKLILALRELRTFLDEQSFRGETWRMLAETLDRMGDSARAREAFAEAARRDVHDDGSRLRAARKPRGE